MKKYAAKAATHNMCVFIKRVRLGWEILPGFRASICPWICDNRMICGYYITIVVGWFVRAGNFHKVGFHTGILEKKPTTWVFRQENPPVHPYMEPRDARKLLSCVFPAENQRKNTWRGFFGKENRPYTQIWNRKIPGNSCRYATRECPESFRSPVVCCNPANAGCIWKMHTHSYFVMLY